MPIIITPTVTSTTIFHDIAAALDDHLSQMTVPALPPVAWENYEYNPTEDTLYLRPVNLQGETIAVTERDQTVGVYQIDIFAPEGEGKNELVVMSDGLADWFAQDTEFSYNGVTVRVKNVSRSPIEILADGWSRLMVEVEYYAFTERR